MIDPAECNSNSVYAALNEFGAPLQGLSAKYFCDPNSFFRMGSPPAMVDILPKISGIDFDAAWKRRVVVEIEDGLTAWH